MASSKQPSEIAKLVALNLKKFSSAFPDEKRAHERLVEAGIPNGNAGRLLTPDGSSRKIEEIAEAAKAVGAQPWQLLLPDLQITQAGGVVSVEGMRARQWPLPSISREVIENLNPTELGRLESTMKSRIKEILDDRALLGKEDRAEEAPKRAKKN